MCWSTIVSTTDTFANVKNGVALDNMVFLNGGDIGAGLYLITPVLTSLPLNTNVLKFKTYSTSTNTSMQIGTMTYPADASTFTVIQTIAVPTSYEGTYTPFTISMVSSTTDMHIAFKYITTNTFQTGYLDNVEWEADALSSADFANQFITAYPNPVKDFLNVSFVRNISKFAVYNLLGQEILVKEVNANQGQIDLSNLATGTYLLKIKTDNTLKTIKVIKDNLKFI